MSHLDYSFVSSTPFVSEGLSSLQVGLLVRKFTGSMFQFYLFSKIQMDELILWLLFGLKHLVIGWPVVCKLLLVSIIFEENLQFVQLFFQWPNYSSFHSLSNYFSNFTNMMLDHVNSLSYHQEHQTEHFSLANPVY